MNRRVVSARALPALLFASIALAAPARAELSRVSGQVVDARTLAPVAGAEIELQNAGGGPGYFRATTDAHGGFAIERVPTDRWYLVTVGAAGYTDWAIEGWQFPAAQRDVRLVVPLDRAGRLTVRAAASDGRTPVRGARVTVRSERGAESWRRRRDPEPGFTGADGSVTFDGLAAGSWNVLVEAAGLRSSESREVPVRQGETTPVTVTLTRPASLSGFIRLADSSGVAGVNVIGRGPSEATATTDADGAFTLDDLPPGRWRVELGADGFEPGTARDGIALAEGEARGSIALLGRPRPAQFSFVLQREVFVPEPDGRGPGSTRPRVGVRAFRVGALDCVLYRVSESRLLDPARGVRALESAGSDTTGLARADSWRYQPPDGPPFAWREAEMTLPHELPPGAYLLVGRAGALERRQLLYVSDLSIVAKRSASRVVVWAGSLRTGLAQAGVRVRLLAPAPPGAPPARDVSRALAEAGGAGVVTDADGLASLPSRAADANVRIVAISDRAGVAVVQSPLAPGSALTGDRLFLFTDRPIYRPGQTVHWKLFARRGTPSGYALPDGARVTLAANGPDGRSLPVAPVALSPSGSADGSLDLPDALPLGDWTVSAASGSSSSSATFGVQAYRKPEYSVTVEPDRPSYVNGDEVGFRIAAEYFFGAPVAGATVRWTLFESRLEPERAWTDEEDETGDDAQPSGGYGRMLQSGETRLDLDGRATVSHTPARLAYDRRLTLEVEVVDGSQRQVSGRGEALVGRGLFTLRIAPRRRLFAAGEPLVADVFASDLLGKPVQAAVSLAADVDAWNPLERRYVRASRPLAQLQGTTSATEGRVRATFPAATLKPGFVTLRARAEDARGNVITAETPVWIYDERVWDYAYRYPVLEALCDRTSLAPGDTAVILVNTDVKDASVLVSVEGRELLDLRVVHLFGNTGIVRVPVRAEWAPNVFVKLHVRSAREVRTATVSLDVARARHDLAIAVTSDKRAYRPRETARFHVTTRDAQGRPVAAEVALGVVDEAIYALRPDRTPKAHDVFYGKIEDAVTTVASFPTLYYGGADKGDHGEVRRDFRDVALWAPAVRTGPGGTADVSVTWPDNLTTWRATARGASDETLVGEATAKALVTRDVVARLAAPRSFVAGDEAQLVSVVTNRTAAALPGVRESFAVAGAARASGTTSATEGIAAGGEARRAWTVTTDAASPRDGSDASATLTFRATSPADADALEQSVPVRPRAVPLRASGAGAVRGSASVRVILPADLVRSGSDVAIEIAPSAGALVAAAAARMGSYPYACTEQAANALRTGAALVALARRRGAPWPGWGDPAARLAPWRERLVSLRHPDGTWGWWSTDDADPYFTALAMDALARSAGVTGVDAARATLQESQDGMLRLLGDVRSDDGEAYVAAHLASVLALPEADAAFAPLHQALDGVLNGLLQGRASLGPSGLACAASACARLGRPADAAKLLDRLWSLTSTGPDGRWLAARGAADADAWLGGDAEATALALSAAARLAPGDARTAELVRWLATHRDGPWWATTRATGEVAIALADWLDAHPDEIATAGAPALSWNGQPLAVSADSSAGALSYAARVPGARLSPGANTLDVRAAGAGTGYWSYVARANVPSPGPAPDRTKLSITREYFRALRTADRRGRPRWLVTPIDPGQPLRVGERVLVRLTLRADVTRRWIQVEDPVPSGCEIDAALPDGVDRPWDAWGEARDDLAAFFVPSLEAGETRVEYLLRPEIAGRFAALPTWAGAMYDPALETRGEEATLTIAAP